MRNKFTGSFSSFQKSTEEMHCKELENVRKIDKDIHAIATSYDNHREKLNNC